MKLWKVRIKTYYFGIQYYALYVLADTESNMLRTIKAHPAYKGDEIGGYEQIDLTDKTNRIL